MGKEQMERLGVDENGRSVGEDEELEELGSDRKLFEDGQDISDEYRRLMMLGGVDHRPVWLREGLEKPRGTKNMGTWTAWVYTKEQMERLGVDENGRSVGEDEELEELGSDRKLFEDGQDISDEYRRLMMLGGVDHRPVWLREGLEKPRGTKNMG